MTDTSIGTTRPVALPQNAGAPVEKPVEVRPPEAPPGRADEVQLSDAVREAQRSEAMQADRLEQIRLAVEEGTYPLDSRQIAESFVALEQLI